MRYTGEGKKKLRWQQKWSDCLLSPGIEPDVGVEPTTLRSLEDQPRTLHSLTSDTLYP